MLEIDEPISIHSYDPSWPQLFAAEAARIAPGLPDAVRIEHIGSTAVPGLDAKPIVDIMIGASSKADSPRIHSHLAYLGYEDLGESGVPGRDYFRLRNRGMFNIALVALDGEHGAIISLYVTICENIPSEPLITKPPRKLLLPAERACCLPTPKQSPQSSRN